MEDKKLDLKPGDSPIPNIRMGEVGTTGLSHLDGHIMEQVRQELRFPQCLDTYRNMYNDPLIYAAINLTINMMSKVDWSVKPPANASEEEIKQAKFIEQCMSDMDISWSEFIKSIMDYLIFGFSVTEKVYRRRNRRSGSSYSDNLIGWRKLATRSQRTLNKWKFSDDGRELLGVYQDLAKVSMNGRFDTLMDSKDYTTYGLELNRSKFLLFKQGSSNGNPEGQSPLAACWLPWKYKIITQEQEAIGISRDMVGMPVLGLHPSYMSEDASSEKKEVYEYYKKVIRNMHSGEQSGLIYPLQYDEHGRKLIDFQLMGVQGGKQYDTDKIIKRYEDEILTALFADILKLGQNNHGSFSLAGVKTNITSVNIDARLREIADVINNDLVKETFIINGWSTERLPTISFEDLAEESIDDFSKMVQRLGSVNFLPRTPEVIANTLKRAGYDNHESFAKMSQADLDNLFTENEVSAGEGMQEGMPSGTGAAQGNNSAINSENAS